MNKPISAGHKEKMEKCSCSHLEIIRNEAGNILRIECIDCKKTWNWNPLLKYWSDSFLGVFKNKEKI